MPHCLRSHDRWLGLWMTKLDVTMVREKSHRVRSGVDVDAASGTSKSPPKLSLSGAQFSDPGSIVPGFATEAKLGNLRFHHWESRIGDQNPRSCLCSKRRDKNGATSSIMISERLGQLHWTQKTLPRHKICEMSAWGDSRPHAADVFV